MDWFVDKFFVLEILEITPPVHFLRNEKIDRKNLFFLFLFSFRSFIFQISQTLNKVFECLNQSTNLIVIVHFFQICFVLFVKLIFFAIIIYRSSIGCDLFNRLWDYFGEKSDKNNSENKHTTNDNHYSIFKF